jgi:hypothetical protein
VEMRRVRGVSFIEVMVVIAMTLLFSIILGNVSIISGNSIEKTTDVSVVMNKSKGAFEKLVYDVNKSDIMLFQYPVNNTAVYTSQDDSTIILRQPAFDSSNEPVANSFKVVIYRVTTTTTASEGPLVLKRYTATIVDGVESSITYEGIVAYNIKTAKIQTAVDQQFWGDYYTAEFTLYAVPGPATPEIPTQFLIGGVDRLDDGKAVLTSNKITTFKAMLPGVRADAIYRIDPTTKVDSTGFNGGSSLYLNFTIAPQWKSVGRETKSKDFVFTSQPLLQNSSTNQ